MCHKIVLFLQYIFFVSRLKRAARTDHMLPCLDTSS